MSMELSDALLEKIRSLLDQNSIRSVSSSIADTQLWSMLIASQLHRAHLQRIEPQQALALMGPGWDMKNSKITIGIGRVHLPERGVCLADLLILHKNFGVRARRTARPGVSRLSVLDRCRFLLVHKDFGEVENALRTPIGYWTLYESHKVTHPCEIFEHLPGSEADMAADPSPSGLEIQSTYAEERGILDNLIRDSQIYRTTDAYRQLMDFVVRFRHMAPYNAMLLNVQRPSLTYAATRQDWAERFGRYPKRRARPLLILKAFGPVEFVYDLLETEGRDVPTDAFSFPATGPISEWQIGRILNSLAKQGIRSEMVDAGDSHGGSIAVEQEATPERRWTLYRLAVNLNHSPNTQFVTIAHELAHLFLGHVGSNDHLDVRERIGHSHAQSELEAESVAYLVCRRNGVAARSETYLSHFVKAAGEIDVYVTMRAVGQIEKLLGLADKEDSAQSGQGELRF